MTRGKLEVFVVSAKGLSNTDFLNKMDPYVKIIYGTQEQKSSVALGKGTEPEWKQSFEFPVCEGVPGLLIKIMDKDTATDDDLVGEAKIPLAPVFSEGTVPPTPYIIVKNRDYCGEIKIGPTPYIIVKNRDYCGEIKIGLAFIPES